MGRRVWIVLGLVLLFGLGVWSGWQWRPSFDPRLVEVRASSPYMEVWQRGKLKAEFKQGDGENFRLLWDLFSERL